MFVFARILTLQSLQANLMKSLTQGYRSNYFHITINSYLWPFDFLTIHLREICSVFFSAQNWYWTISKYKDFGHFQSDYFNPTIRIQSGSDRLVVVRFTLIWFTTLRLECFGFFRIKIVVVIFSSFLTEISILEGWLFL